MKRERKPGNTDASRGVAGKKANDAPRKADADARASAKRDEKAGPFKRLKFGSAGSGGAEFEPGPKRR
jgi:hypothetical protein